MIKINTYTTTARLLRRAFTIPLLAFGLLASAHAAPAFPEFVDPNPSADNGFGSHVVALSTGNVVITSPRADIGGTDTGAVYLFNGATGALISTLVGSTESDQVGRSGVTALTNGNYVVSSPSWDNGAVLDAGAVTWGNGTTGISGAVSPANSLVGSTAGDNVGGDFVGNTGVTALTNGNYVVSSPIWDNGAVADAGAVTWGNGTTGISGAVSPANSLVGSTANDFVGSDGVTALSNGNYVVRSQNWTNGTVSAAGAVTWGNGTTGITGVVSAANSLVGSTAGDFVGFPSVTALTNGNYVVSSQNWDNGAVQNVGAVTWGNGTTGISGVVSAANSLVGSTASDLVGFPSVIALTNGNYVVRSEGWDNGAVLDVGAVTWGSGTTGIIGVVSTANSLVGSTAGDNVGGGSFRSGDGSVTALTNGNYVVSSILWDNGAVRDAGAVTWGNGTTGSSGVVSPANSLVGSTAGDFVGITGVTALTNGNYVVRSEGWDNGAVRDVGAVTWGNGTTGISGAVSTANSLVGSTANDNVGGGSFSRSNGNVTALTNGNYVVSSAAWDNGAMSDVGAVTWGNGTTGIIGVVSTANSLVGSTAGDNVGGGGVTALTNGNYVVRSQSWDNGAVLNVGAVTWGNGTTGISGAVSPANSLVGSTAFDLVGISGVTALTNGNYVVSSQFWNNGAATEAGAVTWGNGTTGSSGVVSAANSLVGLVAKSSLQVTVLDNVNNHFIAPFVAEGKVRVGSQIDGLAPPPNSAPTNIALSNATIAENNTAGATIGTLTATDADAGQTHTFSFASPLAPSLARSVPVGNDNAAFTITNNVLSINAPSNFEVKSSYNIRVRATDNGAPALSFEKNFTITITDVTEGPVVVITTGDAVPGALEGTTFAGSTGLPVANGGDLGASYIKLPSRKIVKALVDSSGIIIKVGDPLTGAGGAEIAKLSSMSFGVFQAELKVGTGTPAATLATNKVVCFENGSGIQVLARSGQAAPGGSTFKSFRASSGDAAGNVFIAGLLNDSTSVDGGLWAIPAGGALTLLVKEGQIIDLGNGPKRVNIITSFPAGVNAQAEGRVHYGSNSIITRITLVNDHAIVTIPADATSSADWTVLARTGGDAPGGIGKYFKLGLPAAEGANVAFSAQLKGAVGVTTANDRIVVANGAVIAREGDEAPGTSGKFTVFESVVAGSGGQASFTANISGATSSTDNGLWEYRGSTLSLVARQGDPAPDLGGGATIANIVRLAQPGGGLGPVFFATLGGTTKTTNVGLFGVPATGGSAVNLARTGDQFDIGGTMRTLTSISALKMDLGNEGVARGYNDTSVFMIGAFGTGRIALIEFPVAP